MSIADVLEFCKGELGLATSQFYCLESQQLSAEGEAYLREALSIVVLQEALGQLKSPHAHPGEFHSYMYKHSFFLRVFSEGCNHCCGYLRFLLQTGEAVQGKFMPVSLHSLTDGAQLPNKINLKHVPNTGNSRIRNQFTNLAMNLGTFLMGECKAEVHHTACLHTQT